MSLYISVMWSKTSGNRYVKILTLFQFRQSPPQGHLLCHHQMVFTTKAIFRSFSGSAALTTYTVCCTCAVHFHQRPKTCIERKHQLLFKPYLNFTWLSFVMRSGSPATSSFPLKSPQFPSPEVACHMWNVLHFSQHFSVYAQKINSSGWECQQGVLQ